MIDILSIIKMTYNIINENIILLILTVAFFGLSTFLSHGYQNRYLLKHNMISLSILLPPIALIITKAISSNFFLSLGMIGALSIIRYRTPVKSGYELALLFGLITIGVVGGVDLKMCFILTIFIVLVAPSLTTGQKMFPNLIIAETSVVSGVQLIITTKDSELDKEIINKHSNKLKNFASSQDTISTNLT